MAERGAGASAQQRAEQQRQKAERLLASASRWERGAQGEAAVAAVLKQLPPIYTVLHDLQVPGSKANIDHLVIGPAGVFVVDAKHWSQPLRVNDGMIWRGRHPIRKELDTVAWEASQASAALGVPVHPMLCFVGASLPTAVVDLAPVRVTTDTALVATILTGQAGYGINDISRLTLLANRHLPPVGTSSPPARPRAEKAAPKRRPSARTTPKRRTQRGSLLGSLAMVGLAVALLWNASTLGSLLSSAVERLLPQADDPAGASPPAAASSPAINGDFSCPQPGGGWTLTFLWPGDGPPAGYALATSADLADWTPFATWTSSAQTAPALPGIAPDAVVNVRSTVAGDPTAPPTDGTFRAPPTPC